MNKLLLYLLILPKGLWRSLGADVAQLQAILNVKLKMDDRKPLGFGRPQRDKKKQAKYSSTLTVIFTFFTGLIYLFPFFAFDNIVLALLFFYTLMMVFLTFGLITDFSNVLIDTRDKLIIFPKPVNDRTVFLSRMLHIFIYFFRIVLPMSLPAWIVMGILKGWKAVIWFPIPLLLMTFICLFLVIACYMLLLRLSSPQKFKEVISYFQVVFTIMLFICYYFLPRLMDSPDIMHLTMQSISWVKYLPTYWLAVCWSWVDSKAGILPGTQWMSAVAVILPFAMLWFTVKVLAPRFMQKLSGLDGVELSLPKTRRVRDNGKSKLYMRLADMVNKTNAARAGFIITWLQSSRSRTFRMRVYPMFGFVPIYFVYILTMNDQSFAATWRELPENNWPKLVLLYMTGVVIMNAINYVTMSEQYRAAWLYYSSPVQTPGQILSGSFKAIWLKYYFPFIAIIGAFVVYVWGATAILDVALAMINVTIYLVCMMRINHRVLPFSMPEQIKSTGGKIIIRSLIVLVLMGGLGFGHHLASLFWWLKLLFIALSSVFLWLVWDGYTKTDWNGIKASEETF